MYCMSVSLYVFCLLNSGFDKFHIRIMWVVVSECEVKICWIKVGIVLQKLGSSTAVYLSEVKIKKRNVMWTPQNDCCCKQSIELTDGPPFWKRRGAGWGLEEIFRRFRVREPWGKHFFLTNFLSSYRNCRDKKKLLRFSGQFTFSVDRASIGITYKYVVVKEEKCYYEYLTEFEPRVRNGIVDRFLLIPDKYLKPGGKNIPIF